MVPGWRRPSPLQLGTFWVAQRFSAAIRGRFWISALAAEVLLLARKTSLSLNLLA
jgi:hypothetical protein